MIRISTGLRQGMMGNGVSDNSMRNLLAGGVMRVYAGTQPSNPDAAETGTLLAEITLDGGEFTPGAGGSSTNGLHFDAAVAGVLSKSAAEIWKGTGLAVGSAGWFRFYDSNENVGASTAAVRFDGSIGTTGADLVMSSTTVGVGTPVAVPTFAATLPVSK